MTSGSEVLSKLLKSNSQYLKIDRYYYWVINMGDFTDKEIEELRKLDISFFDSNSVHLIANFLPDSIRPDVVPKL